MGANGLKFIFQDEHVMNIYWLEEKWLGKLYKVFLVTSDHASLMISSTASSVLVNGELRTVSNGETGGTGDASAPDCVTAIIPIINGSTKM